jgi:serine/threonine protein kinase
MDMDTMPNGQPMENESPLSGLNPADLLRQGMAEDTLAEDATRSFTPPATEDLAPLFPQFEILELIGKGGMGAVYQVRQKDLDRIVALKILPPAIGRSPAFASRFTREAKALAKLNHPGIVTIHEFGQRDGLYFIVMEFVDGVNLAQLMKSGRVSPREALAIVPQICDALQFAHDQGIVHRDIKPENILIDRLGRVKVADFGIAKMIAPVEAHETEAVPSEATIPGMGTPQYMAPEQVEHPSEVDHRADIYALGVVFYQMLTGELPGRELQAPSRKVRIDVRLDEIVLKAMEKNPELRFQQASVMKTRVDELGTESIAPEAASRSLDDKRVDSFAIASFILGTLSFVLWPLGFLPAIVFGHLSRSRIRANPALSGRGFATAGIAIGYAFLTIFLAMILVSPIAPGSAWSKMTSREDGKPFELSRLSSGTPVAAQAGEKASRKAPIHLPGKYGNANLNSPQDEPPKLQFLAWQDEWKADESGAVRHPDDSPVKDAAELQWLRQVQPPGCDVTALKLQPEPRFLHFWFSHPLFDRTSLNEVVLLDERGVEIPLGARGNAAGGSQAANESNGRTGWLTKTISPGARTNLPTRATVRLRYTVGPLERTQEVEVGPNSHNSMSLEGGGRLNAIGQNAWGKAFVALAMDATAMASRRFGVMAVTKDGRTLTASGGGSSGNSDGTGIRVEDYDFDVPLSDVARFIIGSRPVRTMEWKDVVLPGNDKPVRASQPVVAPATPRDGVYFTYTGYMATVLELKGGRFRYWFESDLKRPDEPEYPLSGLYRVNTDTISLQNEQCGQPVWTFRSMDGHLTLWRPDALAIPEQDRHWDMGMLKRYGGGSILVASDKSAEELWERRGPPSMTEGPKPAEKRVEAIARAESQTAAFTAEATQLVKVTGNIVLPKDFFAAQQTRVAEVALVLLDSCRFSEASDEGKMADAGNGISHIRIQFADANQTGRPDEMLITFPLTSGSIWTRRGSQYERHAKFTPAAAMALSAALQHTPSAPFADAAEMPEKEVVAAAQTWLSGIDAGNYAQSWKDAAVFFQAAITEAAWSEALTKARKPLGEMKSRKLLNAQSAKSLPGAPDGDYVVMQFDASFTAKEKAVETVTFMLERNGTWRAAGYFIR